MSLLIRRIAVIILAPILAWQIVRLNVSDHFVAQAEDGDDSAISSALFWDGGHPRALTMRGFRRVAEGRTEEAEEDFARAVKGNPSDARPLLGLAQIRRQRGELAVADEMAELADRLMPVQPNVQRNLAQYWLDRERLDLALPHLSKSLSGNAPKDELFPFLLQVSAHPAGRQSLAPVIAQLPAWWESFFIYATRNTEDATVVRELIALRKASDTVPLSDTEQQYYINYLRTNGLVAEAYLNWVNSLTTEELGALGFLYNGNFEYAISNSGFDWYAYPPKNSGIRITTSTTYGIDGRQALHITFRGKRARFSQLWQDLFLREGRFRVHGKVRTDNLKIRRGLSWIVWCTAGDKGDLGRSDLIKGTSDWRDFEFEITVPPSCTGQRLQLHTIGARDVDHEADGGVWFDVMGIERLGPIEAPEVPAELTEAEEQDGPTTGNPPRVPGMPLLLDR